MGVLDSVIGSMGWSFNPACACERRDAEFRSGIQEVRKIMQNHHLSRQEILNALSDQHAGKSTDTGGGGMLAEIRRFYAG